VVLWTLIVFATPLATPPATPPGRKGSNRTTTAPRKLDTRFIVL